MTYGVFEWLWWKPQLVIEISQLPQRVFLGHQVSETVLHRVYENNQDMNDFRRAFLLLPNSCNQSSRKNMQKDRRETIHGEIARRSTFTGSGRGNRNTTSRSMLTTDNGRGRRGNPIANLNVHDQPKVRKITRKQDTQDREHFIRDNLDLHSSWKELEKERCRASQ